MTDIVERLRARTPYPAPVLAEAADEIERLRAEVRNCHRLNGWSKSKGWWCSCGEWGLRRGSADPFERPWDYRPIEAHSEHVATLLAAATSKEDDAESPVTPMGEPGR